MLVLCGPREGCPEPHQPPDDIICSPLTDEETGLRESLPKITWPGRGGAGVKSTSAPFYLPGLLGIRKGMRRLGQLKLIIPAIISGRFVSGTILNSLHKLTYLILAALVLGKWGRHSYHHPLTDEETEKQVKQVANWEEASLGCNARQCSCCLLVLGLGVREGRGCLFLGLQ